MGLVTVEGLTLSHVGGMMPSAARGVDKGPLGFFAWTMWEPRAGFGRPKQQKDRLVEAAARATDETDVALARRLQAGDTSAFGELVRRYQDRVYNTVWRICGHAEDARDLTQDAFINAYQSIGTFRGQSALYTWLYRIAVNLTLSSMRSARALRSKSSAS